MFDLLFVTLWRSLPGPADEENPVDPTIRTMVVISQAGRHALLDRRVQLTGRSYAGHKYFLFHVRNEATTCLFERELLGMLFRH